MYDFLTRKRNLLFKIIIENLHFNAIIGILDFERKLPQKVVIYCEIGYYYTKDNFIDYALTCKLLKKTMQTQKYLLLEDALVDLEKVLLQKFPNIKLLLLKISKPNILKNAQASLAISKNY